MHLYTAKSESFYTDLSDLLLLLSIGLTAPDRELSKGLQEGSYLHDLSDCFQGIWEAIDAPEHKHMVSQTSRVLASTAKAYEQLKEDEIYHSINREYNRLFINPRNELVPIYESLLVHKGEKTSMFINATCMHAEQTYRHNNFAFEEKGKFPGDHLAIELRYLAYLFASYLATVQNNSSNSAVEEALEDFIQSHVTRWYALFWNEVHTHSKEPFYLLLADVGEALKPILL